MFGSFWMEHDVYSCLYFARNVTAMVVECGKMVNQLILTWLVMTFQAMCYCPYSMCSYFIIFPMIFRPMPVCLSRSADPTVPCNRRLKQVAFAGSNFRPPISNLSIFEKEHEKSGQIGHLVLPLKLKLFLFEFVLAFIGIQSLQTPPLGV